MSTESPEAAEGYRRSPIMRILEKRRVPGSMEHEVMQGVLVGNYPKSKGQGLGSSLRVNLLR